MHRFRVPEIFLGCFLTVAIFAAGMLFERSKQDTLPQARKHEASHQSNDAQNLDTDLTWSTWLTKDAAGFFTFALFIVGIGQAGLFFVQLRYMRIGMRDATMAANASRQGAEAAIEANRLNRDVFVDSQRPWLDVDVQLAGPFVSNLERGRIELAITVRNVGDKPAFNIITEILTFPNSEIGDPVTQYHRLAEQMGRFNHRGSGFGRRLFPDKLFEANRANSTAVWHRDHIVAGIAKGNVLDLPMGICVCVDYASAIDDRHYQTGYIFLLLKEEVVNRAWIGFGLLDGEIPQDELLLALHPLGLHAT